MSGLAEHRREKRAVIPRYGWMAAAPLLILVMVLVGVGLKTPRCDLWVNGRLIADGQESQALRADLAGWASEYMARPLSLEYGGQVWAYRLGELGLILPLAEGEAALEAALRERRWWQRSVVVQLSLEPEWDLVRLEAALVPIRDMVEREPLSASLEVADAVVRVVPSVDGIRVESGGVSQALEALGDGDRIALPVVSVPPAVDTEAIERLGIRRLIAQWSTDYDPSIPRAENVDRAARAFDGLMLKPGEILSYNGTVGPIDIASGWKEAYVIVGGELVPGIGGGVCQVATTLYGAALRAGLEILERHPHQLPVSYIPPSEDAAVAQGYQDLKMLNPGPGHILIRTEAGGGRVTFRIYGDRPAGEEVRIESRVTGWLPFSTRTEVDSALPPGEVQMVRSGVPGITSEAYRLLYRDGELVRREVLSRDRYLPTAEVVHVGPGEPGASGDD